ncbi:MAG: hypothetical protein R3343_04785 [Nitriliruptorales bacterium]|nr:hypothetical protein [Nitriliruptorales bacterium]
MTLLDRVVRETRRELAPMEGLIGCVQGREHGGRRRLVVIATDQRVFLVGPRRGNPVRLEYPDIEQISIEPGDDGDVLAITMADGDTHQVDRITDQPALELLVDLVSTRSAADPLPQERPPKVRIIHAD